MCCECRKFFTSELDWLMEKKLTFNWIFHIFVIRHFQFPLLVILWSSWEKMYKRKCYVASFSINKTSYHELAPWVKWISSMYGIFSLPMQFIEKCQSNKSRCICIVHEIRKTAYLHIYIYLCIKLNSIRDVLSQQ